jgi:hypothetical protein
MKLKRTCIYGNERVDFRSDSMVNEAYPDSMIRKGLSIILDQYWEKQTGDCDSF